MGLSEFECREIAQIDATNASNSGAAELSSEDAPGDGDLFTVNDEIENLRVATLGKDIKIACILVAKEEGLHEEEKLDVTFETVANLSYESVLSCSRKA